MRPNKKDHQDNSKGSIVKVRTKSKIEKNLLITATILLAVSATLRAFKVKYDDSISDKDCSIKNFENEINTTQNLYDQEQRFQGIADFNWANTQIIFGRSMDEQIQLDTLSAIGVKPNKIREIQGSIKEVYHVALKSVYSAAKSQKPDKNQIDEWLKIDSTEDFLRIFDDYKTQYENNKQSRTDKLNGYQNFIKEKQAAITNIQSEITDMQKYSSWMTIVATILNVASIIFSSWASFLGKNET
jgi:hypothetical protein